MPHWEHLNIWLCSTNLQDFVLKELKLITMNRINVKIL
jgi:hypothetical protein